VAQRGGGCGEVEGVGEGLLQVARVLPAGRERARLHLGRVLLPGPPGDEVAGVLGQGGHAGGGDVEQVRVVEGAERGPSPRTVRRVDDDHVDAGAALVGGAGEVQRDERARRATADDHDLGTTRPRGTLRHD
jgi:hypothetical protein